jgi:hypothetical protein
MVKAACVALMILLMPSPAPTEPILTITCHEPKGKRMEYGVFLYEYLDAKIMIAATPATVHFPVLAAGCHLGDMVLHRPAHSTVEVLLVPGGLQGLGDEALGCEAHRDGGKCYAYGARTNRTLCATARVSGRPHRPTHVAGGIAVGLSNRAHGLCSICDRLKSEALPIPLRVLHGHQGHSGKAMLHSNAHGLFEQQRTNPPAPARALDSNIVDEVAVVRLGVGAEDGIERWRRREAARVGDHVAHHHGIGLTEPAAVRKVPDFVCQYCNRLAQARVIHVPLDAIDLGHILSRHFPDDHCLSSEQRRRPSNKGSAVQVRATPG